MLRFSLLTLLFVVLVAALGSAALANPNEVWLRIIFNLTLVFLLAATVAAFIMRWPFAVGFAVVGWIYFALAFIDSANIRRYMVTDWALTWLSVEIVAPPPLPSYAPSPYRPATGYYSPPIPATSFSTAALPPVATYQPVVPSTPTPPNVVSPYWAEPPYFPAIGHSLWTLILACLGGLAGGWLQRRNQPEKHAGNKQDNTES